MRKNFEAQNEQARRQIEREKTSEWYIGCIMCSLDLLYLGTSSGQVLIELTK